LLFVDGRPQGSDCKDESELDAVIAKLEEVKRQLADPLIEAQRLAAKRFKHDAHLHQLSEKSETAKKALDKLMLQTVEQEQYHGRILASIEVLRKQKISLRADPSVGPRLA
jgi:predicted  nucleic acid-binding Zn-ribbon protein